MNIYDQLKQLWEKVLALNKRVDTLDIEIPEHGAGDAGKYLGVDNSGDLEFSNPFPAFSETETATGYKWIDGKEIYCKVYVGNTQESTSAETIDTFTFNFVKSDYLLNAASGNWYKPGSGFHLLANDTTGVVSIDVGASAFYNRPYIAFLYYTKPTPVPTKAAKKKATK